MTVILIDDLRNFKDAREAVVARTSAEGLKVLKRHHSQEIRELWLDHDLGIVDGVKDDIKKVVQELEEKAFQGQAYNIRTIYVHTSNVVGGNAMMQGLKARGYNVVRVPSGQNLYY